MRQFRFICIALLTSLFLINTVFWRKAIAVLLCSVLSFNSASCYSFLSQGWAANAQTSVPTKKLDLTGEWIGKGTPVTFNQRGCTSGATTQFTVDGKDGYQPFKLTFTQNGNQLTVPDNEVVGSGWRYTQHTKGTISGNRISLTTSANTQFGYLTIEGQGTVSEDGNTVTGQTLCKISGGQTTAKGPFIWIRKKDKPLTVYLGGAGMDGSYIPDQIEALKEVGVQNVVAGKFTSGQFLDVIDSLYIKRLEHYSTLKNQPFTLNLLGIKDDGQTPLNFIGYSYGSLIAAQCAYYYATHERKIGKLVLIGSPIEKNLLDKLRSSQNIEQVIVVNLTEYGDEIYAGMSFTELDHIGLIKLVKDLDSKWGHFYYALENNEGKKRRRDLANKLWKDGLR